MSVIICRTAVICLLIFILIIASVQVGAEDDGLACTFRGTVEAAGYEVTGGTRITATIEGDDYHTHTPLGDDSSTYSITIRPEDGKNYPNGTEVIFSISGYSAEQKGIYYAGSDFNLDLSTVLYQPVQLSNDKSILTYGSAEGGNTNFNWGMAAGLFVGTLLTLGLIYYAFLIRRLAIRKSKSDMEIIQTQSTKSPSL